MLLSLPRHPRPSLCPSSSSALRDWWLVSAAQAFLPITERVEVEGAEPGLHILTLIFYWLIPLSFTRRWTVWAMAGDDWPWILSVKAAETSNKFLDARVGRALLVAGLRKWWTCLSALWCARDVEFPPSELRFADGLRRDRWTVSGSS